MTTELTPTSAPQTTTLTPPAAEAFTLAPPAPVQELAPESAAGKVPLKPEEVAALDGQVQAFISQVTSHDSHDAVFKEAVERIHNMGNKEITAAANMSNRMLDRPVQSLNNGLISSDAGIGKSLVDLRHQVEDLDPSRQGDIFSVRKILGLIPFGNRITNYFDRYKSAQSHLNAIVDSLKRGKDELVMDNAAIEQEKTQLWDLMGRIEKYVLIGKKLDEQLTLKLVEFDTTDPDKARIVREEMLFYIRQKCTDLLVQQSVNVQGYLAFDIIRKSNLELIKGVDRATTTTISALRVAIIVAQALNNQKLVLDQITALNTTTGNIIESTSKMLRDQSAEIYEQAATSTIKIEQLQKSFENIYQALDTIDSFKLKALDSMKTTVDTLTTTIEKSKTYVERVRQQEAASVLKDVRSDEVTL